jgi:excisionase family DNA binding protein
MGMDENTPGAMVKLLLTPDEAAEALAIGRTLLYRLAMSREIASIKVGGARRFPLRSLEAYIERLSEVQRKR